MMDELGNADYASRGKLGGHHEEAQGKRLEKGTCHDQDIITDGGPGGFQFVHHLITGVVPIDLKGMPGKSYDKEYFTIRRPAR
jgi:hypothetical protein